MPGSCHLNEKWLEKDAYKSWLPKDDKNSNKAFCFAFKTSIDLNVMGESALVSHMKGVRFRKVAFFFVVCFVGSIDIYFANVKKVIG